jgi:hypothetical protein
MKGKRGGVKEPNVTLSKYFNKDILRHIQINGNLAIPEYKIIHYL